MRAAALGPRYALVPLRVFLGGTFVVAGMDKLLTPGFFSAGVPGSIQDQLAAFARHSPLAPLIQVVEPWAAGVGLGIALLELAIGIGALTAYGFRIAAASGFGLSILFWLTASWTTHPFYLGADLPFAAGWLTLLLAGPGEVLVPRWARTVPGDDPAGGRSVRPIARRAVLEAGVLGIAALVLASLSVPLRVSESETTDVPGEIDGGPGGRPSPGPSGSPPVAPTGIAVGSLLALGERQALPFTIPFDAPAPLPAGDPGVLIKLADGTYVAFDAICTHAGCTVEFDPRHGLLVCPCHGATFDPHDHGAVIDGPTDQPLVSLPLALDPATGTFRLRTA